MGFKFSFSRKNFELQDVFSNSRNAVVLTASLESRRTLGHLLDSSIDFPKILGGDSRFNIDIIKNEKECLVYDDAFYDCRDWAFDKVGLPEYTFREGGKSADALRFESFRNACWIPEPEKGSIVMYINDRTVSHWGVVEDVGENILVNSKWGKGYVYRHGLEEVPDYYGDFAEFLRV